MSWNTASMWSISSHLRLFSGFLGRAAQGRAGGAPAGGVPAWLLPGAPTSRTFSPCIRRRFSQFEIEKKPRKMQKCCVWASVNLCQRARFVRGCSWSHPTPPPLTSNTNIMPTWSLRANVERNEWVTGGNKDQEECMKNISSRKENLHFTAKATNNPTKGCDVLASQSVAARLVNSYLS